MRICAGSLDDLPTDRCVAIGDGSVVVVRSGDGAAAFRNRCLHRDSRLEGGRVRGDVLACPQHFWTYRLPEGEHVGGRGRLPSYPVEVGEDGRVWVDAPDPEQPMSLRERLLAHAREWERDR